ncbi:DNA polymerase alpha subunit B [Tyrophagus putrescentiae]|nr:DNA polymerase alpha subunit B [Tyrophagus putrescentiae]
MAIIEDTVKGAIGQPEEMETVTEEEEEESVQKQAKEHQHEKEQQQKEKENITTTNTLTLEEELEMEFEEDLSDLYSLPDNQSSQSSRVLLSYGRTLSEEDWIKKTTSSKNSSPAAQAQYYDSANALHEPYKYMSARLAEANQALNNYLDGTVYAIKAHCEDLAKEYEGSASTADDNNNQLDEEEKELRLIINDLAEEETLMGRLTEKTAVETYYVGRIRYGLAKVGGTAGPPPASQGESSDPDQPVSSPPPPMSLFPGAIVLLKGQNPTGAAITVSRFIDLGALFSRGPRAGDHFPAKCPPALIASAENAHHHPQMSIVCASGPFVSFEGGSSVQDLNLLDSTYMKALASYISQHSPDYLLLFGPLFDAEQQSLITDWCVLQNLTTTTTTNSSNSLATNWTPERLFNHQLRTLTKHFEGRKEVRTQILLIPSASEFPGGPGSEASLVFPTPPVERKCRQPGVQYYSNPAMLSLGGVAVGATATDILRHMGRQEISNISSNAEGAKGSDHRLHRLSAHLLAHKHFYPLLPAETGVNLECSQYDKLVMPVTPHLLILPSMLRPFVYNVQQTVVVNPGKVNKNSIARILIDPVKGEGLGASPFEGSIAQYVNVEVIKLIA